MYIINGAYDSYEVEITMADGLYSARLLQGNDILYSNSYPTTIVYQGYLGEEEKFISQDIVSRYEIENIHTSFTMMASYRGREYKIITEPNEEGFNTTVYEDGMRRHECGWTDPYLIEHCYPFIWNEYIVRCAIKHFTLADEKDVTIRRDIYD